MRQAIERVLAAALIAGACGTPGALAQIARQGGPIDITSEELQVLDAERAAIFIGNVDARQGDARLQTQRLRVEFAPGSGGQGLGASFGEIQRLIAEGRVFYTTPREKAAGDRGVYNVETDEITLTGNVAVTRGDNVIAGDKIIIDVRGGRTTISSDQAPTNGAPKRVRTVIVPGQAPQPQRPPG
jgi:lipopolysaccharide export system protein LptA